MSMLHSAAEPFRVIFDALDASTVQVPVSMAASMSEALDAATAQVVDFTVASILGGHSMRRSRILSPVRVTSLVIRAALDASSARMAPVGRDGHGHVGVRYVVDRLVDGRRQASALGLHHYVFHNIVVGLDRDFIGRLAGDDDLHGACRIHTVEIRGVDGARDDVAAAFEPLPKSTDGAAMQTKYVVAVIMVPSRTAIKSILFMVAII